jgi:AcrR family transcriptional regulator
VSRIGEPQNRRSRETRAALLDAAWALLEEQGAERTTMAAVAERSGVSRRALYLHFASRADLLLALHAHVDERLDLAASVAPVFDAIDAVAALDAFVAHLARFHARTLAVDLALLRAKDDDPDVARLVQQGVDAWRAGCARIARRLADEGRLAEPWTVDEATDLLWNQMFPDGFERLTVQRGWSLERYRELVTLLLRRTLVADAAAPDAEPLAPIRSSS